MFSLEFLREICAVCLVFRPGLLPRMIIIQDVCGQVIDFYSLVCHWCVPHWCTCNSIRYKIWIMSCKGDNLVSLFIPFSNFSPDIFGGESIRGSLP